jgi:hypothetical protein
MIQKEKKIDNLYTFRLLFDKLSSAFMIRP